MNEQIGNLWYFHNKGEWIAITTNGFVKKDSTAVMGRGCALECRTRYTEFPKILGTLIKKYGNIPFHIRYKIFSLPVKHNWWEEADIKLIEKSLVQLVEMVSIDNINRVYIPRPGCGNGKLDWETQVKPICEKLLDDRFIVLSRE